VDRPLYIAAQADVSVRRAARIGDAWLIVNSSGLGKVAPLMQTYRAALKEYGRTPMEFPITVECYVGARAMPRHIRNVAGRWNTNTTPMRHGAGGSHFGVVRRFCARPVHHRDKGSVKEEIARYRELLGVDHFIMRCQWPGLPQEQVLSSIQRLGEIFAS